MKKSMTAICLLVASYASLSLAGSRSADLSEDAAHVIGVLMRDAERNGNKAIVFKGGPQVTSYSVGNLSCYFQNADDSVSCSADNELSESAATLVGELLRQAQNSGNRKIVFQGGRNVTTYSVGNTVCYFQNVRGGVSCSVGQ